jgi:hypothetical protein
VRAERSCDRRERALAEFDLRAVEMVRRLRVAGMLPPSATWDTDTTWDTDRDAHGAG